MKKTIALLLCAIIVFSALPFAVSASRFIDVEDGKWYSEGIEFCAMNGYMAGVSETEFDRNGTLTRAMFVTILASIEGVSTEYYQYNPCFSDVAVGKWYSGAVAWAYKNGLASGLGDGTFGYKNPVTREQIAVFMLAYAEYLNESNGNTGAIDINARADLSGYTDAEKIHSWASDAVAWAVASGIISGTSDTTLDPRGNCTRAQAAIIIQNFVLKVNAACEHEWVEPTCTEYGYCALCFIVNETYADHSYDENNVCTVCGATYDNEDDCGHIWIKEGCTSDSYCSLCGKVEKDATEHIFESDEDDTIFKSCTVCGYITCINEHTPIDATCMSQGYCSMCGEILEEPLGHKMDEDGICIHCGGCYNEEDGCFHIWQMPDCENDGYCIVCGKPGEKSDGHDFQYGECNNCGMKICVHVWIEATCIEPGYCSLCYEIDESSPAKGHDYSSGNIGCKKCSVLHDPAFTFHQNVINNILMRGTTLPDASKAFVMQSSDELTESTATLFLLPGNYESVFSSLVSYDHATDTQVTIELELKDPADEYKIEIEATTAGKFAFSISGTVDPETFYLSGVTVVDSYTEADYDQDTLKLIADLYALTSVQTTETLLKKHTNVSIADYGFDWDSSAF